MVSTTVNDKVFKGTAIVLFAFMFVYLLLRIIINEPLHDEVATYMFYIYQGNYWGETIHWDANNHLLNSFICHQLYKVFGDNMAVFRLPNLVAFIFFFFGTVHLTKNFKTPFLKTLALLALNTIPFYMEYFGNTRGYGLSFGFLVWGIVYFNDFLTTRKTSKLILAYFFLTLTISANLTLVNTCFILIATAIGSSFFSNKMSLGKHIKESFIHLAFLGALYPFIKFAFKLKEQGALYYGSLDGIWDVTGKTISKYTIFYDADWLRFAYLFVFIVFLIYTFFYLVKTKRVEWFDNPKLVYALLLFGNLCAILAMAYLMAVLYPEDRVGMYLILFFLLLCFHFLDDIKIGKWLQFSLLFFPISMLFHLSLHTSVFSPDDRLNQEFYQKIKAELKPENTLHIYRIMNWGWPYAESHVKEKSSVGQFDNANGILSDILITKTTVLTNPKVLELYDILAYYEPSTHIAFKRKKPLKRESLFTIKGEDSKSENEFYDFANINCDTYEKKNLLLSVSGHLKTFKKFNSLILVVASKLKDGSDGRYLYYSFETAYQGQLINGDFLHHFVIENIASDETELKIYLWNRTLSTTQLTNVSATIYELKE
ncbi:MAG: hypothetical protein QNL29_07210 [Crocinitomicaceae bacterium]